MGLVYRVDSCPRCIEGALRWFGTQLELFGEGESVSVSAVLLPEKDEKQYAARGRSIPDDLPF